MTTTHPDAPGAGPVTPGSDEAPAGDAARGSKERTADRADSATGLSRSVQALRVLAGERKAAEFLARLRAQQAEPDELAVIVSMLYGPELRGFCAVVAKALRGGA